MPKTWFTSDTHFWAEYLIFANWNDARPYASTEEMNKCLVDNWNEKVGELDEIYFLGDLSNRVGDELDQLFNRLKGNKHLIIGNHDERKPQVLGLEWKSAPTYQKTITVDGQLIFLCHLPVRSWPYIRKGSVHLYGHVHGDIPADSLSCDVGVDQWNFYPIEIEQALDKMRNSTEHTTNTSL